MKDVYLLAIDQGTTSTRAVVYDAAGTARGSAARELSSIIPGRAGWSTTPRRSGAAFARSCRGRWPPPGSTART